MKYFTRILTLGLAAFCLSSGAYADIIKIIINENGVGVGTKTQGYFHKDIGPGGLASALTYTLPVSTFRGDVLLTDASGISEVLRFNGNTVVFYSDKADGVDALADTGLPSKFYAKPKILTLSEIGFEGVLDGAIYTPTKGQPGYSSKHTMVYTFISDVASVPEPSAIVLMGTVLLFGMKFGRRFAGQRASKSSAA